MVTTMHGLVPSVGFSTIAVTTVSVLHKSRAYLPSIGAPLAVSTVSQTRSLSYSKTIDTRIEPKTNLTRRLASTHTEG